MNKYGIVLSLIILFLYNVSCTKYDIDWEQDFATDALTIVKFSNGLECYSHKSRFCNARLHDATPWY